MLGSVRSARGCDERPAHLELRVRPTPLLPVCRIRAVRQVEVAVRDASGEHPGDEKMMAAARQRTCSRQLQVTTSSRENLGKIALPPNSWPVTKYVTRAGRDHSPQGDPGLGCRRSSGEVEGNRADPDRGLPHTE